MKHKRQKTYLKLGILLFGISLLFHACQKDETIVEEHNNISLNGFHFSTLKSVKELTRVKNNALRLVGNNNNEFGRSNNSEYYFSIDTMVVQTLASDNYTSYTFIAQLNEPDTTALHNYVLTFFDNDSIHEMLVKYPRVFNNPNQNYDMDNITAQPIEGDLSLLGRSICDGYAVTSWDPNANCVDYNCGLSGDHSPGQACEDGVYRAFRHCVGAWVTDCIPPPSDNDGNPDDGSGGGGGGSGNDDAIDIIPLDECIAGVNETDDNGNCFVIDDGDDELSSRRECNKIKRIIQDYNSEFMTKVRDLKNKDSLTFESSVAVFEDNSIGEYQGAPGTTTVQSLPINPSSNYAAMAHVHNETDTIRTYSVPSLGDLQWIATMYSNNYLDSTEFVAFLATADGTYFALTINDANKFWEFFKYVDTWNPQATQQEKIEATENISQKILIREKYYLKDTNSLIKRTAQGASNNEQQLRYFMQFLEEANAGVTVFETDENFNSFTELSLNGFSVERDQDPCQF